LRYYSLAKNLKADYSKLISKAGEEIWVAFG
jgi:hypothetical protein